MRRPAAPPTPYVLFAAFAATMPLLSLALLTLLPQRMIHQTLPVSTAAAPATAAITLQLQDATLRLDGALVMLVGADGRFAPAVVSRDGVVGVLYERVRAKLHCSGRCPVPAVALELPRGTGRDAAADPGHAARGGGRADRARRGAAVAYSAPRAYGLPPPPGSRASR